MAFVHKDGNKEGQVTRSKYLIISRDLERVFFLNSQFWNENGQNVKCARSFIPHSYSGMDRTPFHPFCSQGQNEQNVANAFRTKHSHSRIVNKERALRGL